MYSGITDQVKIPRARAGGGAPGSVLAIARSRRIGDRIAAHTVAWGARPPPPSSCLLLGAGAQGLSEGGAKKV